MAKVLKNFCKVFDILPIYFPEPDFIQRVAVELTDRPSYPKPAVTCEGQNSLCRIFRWDSIVPIPYGRLNVIVYWPTVYETVAE